jgi:hypothetical protein
MEAKQIRLKSEADFQRLRDRIDEEVSHARHHWSLFKGLQEASAEYAFEMNESNTFWHLTFIAHLDAVVSHLGRLYDKHTGALSLGRFIETVRANRNLFSDEAFKERLKDNPHVETLVEGREISDAILDAELASVSESEPLVVNLWSIRDSMIAHIDAEKVRTGAAATQMRWPPLGDIEVLLDRASAITGKYSFYYGASAHGGIAGGDDYKSLLRWVRKALIAHRAGIQRIQEAGQ